MWVMWLSACTIIKRRWRSLGSHSTIIIPRAIDHSHAWNWIQNFQPDAAKTDSPDIPTAVSRNFVEYRYSVNTKSNFPQTFSSLRKLERFWCSDVPLRHAGASVPRGISCTCYRTLPQFWWWVLTDGSFSSPNRTVSRKVRLVSAPSTRTVTYFSSVSLSSGKAERRGMKSYIRLEIFSFNFVNFQLTLESARGTRLQIFFSPISCKARAHDRREQ